VKGLFFLALSALATVPAHAGLRMGDYRAHLESEKSAEWQKSYTYAEVLGQRDAGYKQGFTMGWLVGLTDQLRMSQWNGTFSNHQGRPLGCNIPVALDGSWLESALKRELENPDPRLLHQLSVPDIDSADIRGVVYEIIKRDYPCK